MRRTALFIGQPEIPRLHNLVSLTICLSQILNFGGKVELTKLKFSIHINSLAKMKTLAGITPKSLQ